MDKQKALGMADRILESDTYKNVQEIRQLAAQYPHLKQLFEEPSISKNGFKDANFVTKASLAHGVLNKHYGDNFGTFPKNIIDAELHHNEKMKNSIHNLHAAIKKDPTILARTEKLLSNKEQGQDLYQAFKKDGNLLFDIGLKQGFLGQLEKTMFNTPTAMAPSPTKDQEKDQEKGVQDTSPKQVAQKRLDLRNLKPTEAPKVEENMNPPKGGFLTMLMSFLKVDDKNMSADQKAMFANLDKMLSPLFESVMGMFAGNQGIGSSNQAPTDVVMTTNAPANGKDSPLVALSKETGVNVRLTQVNTPTGGVELNNVISIGDVPSLQQKAATNMGAPSVQPKPLDQLTPKDPFNQDKLTPKSA